MVVRPSAVAGAFYPANPERLISDVDQLLAQVVPSTAQPPKALIVPHAGYRYSGIVAAHGYAQLRPQREMLRRVVIFGPAHFVPLTSLALPKAAAFQTPLGTVEIDRDIAAGLEALPEVTRDAAAHAREHSLEVQLPFLQRTLTDFRIIPLVVGEARPDEVASVMDAAWGDASTVILVSSDLSHYLPYEEAVEVDRQTADQVLALGPTPLTPEQACGSNAINGLLVTASRRGLRPKLLDLRNSGDTAGPHDEVVGYSAFAFYE